jgi:hypothetical protein
MPIDGGSRAYERAAAVIRDSTKWITAAFAVVGGALLAALPLSGVNWTQLSVGRLGFALLSLFVALSGVGLVVLFAGRVLTTEYAALRDLNREHVRIAQISARRAIRPPGEQQTPAWWASPVLYGVAEAWSSLAHGQADDIPDLNRRLEHVHRAIGEISKHLPMTDEQEHALERYRRQADELGALSDRIVSFADTVSVQAHFSMFLRVAGLAVFLVIVGAIGLVATTSSSITPLPGGPSPTVSVSPLSQAARPLERCPRSCPIEQPPSSFEYRASLRCTSSLASSGNRSLESRAAFAIVALKDL